MGLKTALNQIREFYGFAGKAQKNPYLVRQGLSLIKGKNLQGNDSCNDEVTYFVCYDQVPPRLKYASARLRFYRLWSIK